MHVSRSGSVQFKVLSLSCLCLAVLAAVAMSGCAHSSRKDSGESIAGHAAQPMAGEVNAQDALKRLVDGNARFMADKTTHPNIDAARRAEVKQGQKPFAIVLGCADSRLSPELIFDTGLGEIFVVRVAGNITDDVVVGSIEYAVEHLGARLIVVLGHEKCGAVDAALHALDTHERMHGHIQMLVEAIDPAIRGRTMIDDPGDRLDDAIRANVRYVSNQLATSKPILAKFTNGGGLEVVGGYYDLESGRVELLDVK